VKGGEHAMSQAIYLTDELYTLLQKAAAARGQTPEETLNELLHDALVDGNGARPTSTEASEERPLPFIGMLTQPGIEPRLDWAARHDEIIAEEALDHHAEEH
jgi:hypothetical protein